MKRAFIYCCLISLLSLMQQCTSSETTGPHKTISGSWKCLETSVGGSKTYAMEIDRMHSDTTMYVLTNVYNSGIDGSTPITAKLSKKALTISASQPIGGTFIVRSGSGTVSDDNNRIELNYVVYNGSSDIAVKTIMTR